jgi:hypothetical protein
LFEPDPLGCVSVTEWSDLPVMPVAEFVYPVASQAWQLSEEVTFTESLILAQDERWRRA